MRDKNFHDLLQRQQQLASQRHGLEKQWQDIAELMRPQRARFLAQPQQLGERRDRRLYDSTATIAAINLAAALWSLLSSTSDDWFSFDSPSDADMHSPAMQRWLQYATKVVRNRLALGNHGFYARVFELYHDLVLFGTGVFYAEDSDDGLYFACRHLAECQIAENAQEKVDTVYRRYSLTLRQAAQRWGDSLPANLARVVDKEPQRRVELLHVVMPSKEWQGNHQISLPFISLHGLVAEGDLLGIDGYHEMPYMVPRWASASYGLYGDSPAMAALADVKMLNAMAKTTLVAAQKSVDPPLLASDEAALRGIQTTPGGIIYGGLDANGRRLYEPLNGNGNISLGLEMEEQRRHAIRNAFFAPLLELGIRPNMTATEILARQEQQLRLLGPHVGRLTAEFLEPLLTRIFHMLARRGDIPPPPQSSTAPIKISYRSPMARQQKAKTAQAVEQMAAAIPGLLALDPNVAAEIDVSAMLKTLAEGYALPTEILRQGNAPIMLDVLQQLAPEVPL